MSDNKELKNEETKKVNGGWSEIMTCPNTKCHRSFNAEENYFHEKQGCTEVYFWKCPYCGTKIVN